MWLSPIDLQFKGTLCDVYRFLKGNTYVSIEEVLGTLSDGNFEHMTTLGENWCWNSYWNFYQKYQEFWQSIN